MTDNNPHLFLDIDSVMVTTEQYFTKKTHPKFKCAPFDSKCVKVLNEIIEKVNPIIILSSDWRLFFEIYEMNEIFKFNNVNATISGITTDLWGEKFASLTQLEEARATEILMYVRDHEITNWVAVDDLNLKPWISNNFVYCTKANEGIKQSNVKEKILKTFENNVQIES